MQANPFVQLHHKAIQYYKSGDFAAALKILDELNTAFPNQQELLYLRLLCLNKLGRNEEALTISDWMISLFNDERARSFRNTLKIPPGEKRLQKIGRLTKHPRKWGILPLMFCGAVFIVLVLLALLIFSQIGLPERSFYRYRLGRTAHVEYIEPPGPLTETASGDGVKVSILDTTSFHGATRSGLYKEGWPEDKGGVLHVFLKSNAVVSDRLKNVRINGNVLSGNDAVHWWRMWPDSIGASCPVGTLTIKSFGPPLERGARVELEVEMMSGATSRRSLFLNTPYLRLANVLPAPGMEELWLYVRNDGPVAATITAVEINDESFVLGESPRISVVGSSRTVIPGMIMILKVSFPEPLTPLSPLAARVYGTAGDKPVWVGGFLRVVEPAFVLGTWNTDLAVCPLRHRLEARKLGIDVCVNYSDWDRLNELAKNFHIRTLSIINDESLRTHPPDISKARSQIGNPTIKAWAVLDEPELSRISATDIFANNQALWRTDPTHPTYLNLMSNTRFNEYGHIPDIVCQDHYVMFAPNVVNWTGSLRKAKLEESLEYAMLLKENTEPARMWAWTQLCAEVWGRPPVPWGISYQFWGQIMSGAKGMLWFVYGPGREEKYHDQVAKGHAIIQRLNPIRTLCFYGEPVDNIAVSDKHILARSLVSEAAVLVIALNNNYANTGLTFRSAYKIWPVTASLTVPLPGWAAAEAVYQISETGELEPVAHEIIKGAIRFDGVHFNEEPQIFLIGRRDSEAPESVSSLTLIPMNNGQSVLSWSVPHDNWGIQGYKVFADAVELAETPYPFHIVPNSAIRTNYGVQAFDASGNNGAVSTLASIGG